MSNQPNKEPSERPKELPSTQGTFAKCIIANDEAHARERWEISWNYIVTPWQKYNGLAIGFIFLFSGIAILVFAGYFLTAIFVISTGVYHI